MEGVQTMTEEERHHKENNTGPRSPFHLAILAMHKKKLKDIMQKQGHQIVNTSDKECPICWNEFTNNEEIISMDCHHDHLLCKLCAWQLAVSKIQEANGEEVEELHTRFNQDYPPIKDINKYNRETRSLFAPAIELEYCLKCPVCRGLTWDLKRRTAQNYYPGSGRDQEHPITID